MCCALLPDESGQFGQRRRAVPVGRPATPDLPHGPPRASRRRTHRGAEVGPIVRRAGLPRAVGACEFVALSMTREEVAESGRRVAAFARGPTA